MSCFGLKLCNYNQSVVLKELGFPQKNVDVKFSYAPCTIVNDYVLSKFDEEENYPVAPSLALAADWLRKEKNIHINPIYNKKFSDEWYICEVNTIFVDNKTGGVETYDSYDDALSAAIDKAIEMIKRNN